jgi:hypothetical protein
MVHLVPQKWPQEDNAGDRVQENEELISETEWQEPDHQSGNRFECQKPGDQDRKTGSPFASPRIQRNVVAHGRLFDEKVGPAGKGIR